MCRFPLAAALAMLTLTGSPRSWADESASVPPPDGSRVVFLGDSITYSGQYIEYVETVLRCARPSLKVMILNLGLPSETVSGLSEPGHAGGEFPRPDLHERLDRVLAQTKPNLVVACYGMNDGIYYPFSEERFARYREGMARLREKAGAAGAKVLHLTPPVFDPEPIRARTLPAGRDAYPQPFEGYDEVLTRYADWLLSERAHGWDVLDIHGPMARHLIEERKRDPAYHLAGDGVHANDVGHWIMARPILQHWGVDEPAVAAARSADEALNAFPHGMEVLKLVQQRQRVLKDAWLTATGHTRPGMNKGLPLDEAQAKAQAIEMKLRDLLAPR